MLGTRPEIVKMAHIVRILGPAARIIHTGQHYDTNLSDVFFTEFGLPAPTVHLGIGGATRGSQIGDATRQLDEHFAVDRPAAVVVQGDTNTTMAAAIAANAREIPLVHIEAGLRSYDRRMPEEHNRVVTDHLSDLLCTPTITSRDNLAREGIDMEQVRVTGNTVVEAVRGLLPPRPERLETLADHGLSAGDYVLATFHRPENVDDPATWSSILEALVMLDRTVVLPMHPRSAARAASFGLGDLLDELSVVEPIGYRSFLGLMAESAYLVSDSGGVQEEVSVVKRPAIIVRRSTERPEVLDTFARLVLPGQPIVDMVDEWLTDPTAVHDDLAALASPYGDGTASQQSVDALVSLLERP